MLCSTSSHVSIPRCIGCPCIGSAASGSQSLVRRPSSLFGHSWVDVDHKKMLVGCCQPTAVLYFRGALGGRAATTGPRLGWCRRSIGVARGNNMAPSHEGPPCPLPVTTDNRTWLFPVEKVPDMHGRSPLCLLSSLGKLGAACCGSWLLHGGVPGDAIWWCSFLVVLLAKSPPTFSSYMVAVWHCPCFDSVVWGSALSDCSYTDAGFRNTCRVFGTREAQPLVDVGPLFPWLGHLYLSL